MKKNRAIIVGLLTLVIFLLPGFSMAQSVVDLQAQIRALVSEVQALQTLQAQQSAQNNQSNAGQPAFSCHTFTANLRAGQSGSEVQALQAALKKDGESTAVTGIFDARTVSAVVAFQEKYRGYILTPNGLRSGTGYVGGATEKKLNALYGCQTSVQASVPPLQSGTTTLITTTSTVTTSTVAAIAAPNSLTVSRGAGIQTYVASGQNNVLIGNYLLTAAPAENVNLSSITLSATSSYVQNIKVFVNGYQLGATLGSGTDTFVGASPVVIFSGTVVKVQAFADIASSASGQLNSATAILGCAASGATTRTAIVCNGMNGWGMIFTAGSGGAGNSVPPITTVTPSDQNQTSTLPAIPVIASISPSSGPALSSVTITGSNFTATANTVQFGGTMVVSNLSSNGTSLTVTIPNLTPGSYAVSVSNANGASNAVSFNIPNPIVPNLITAGQVFDTSMIGRTWHFIDGYGDNMWIDIQAAPQPVIAGYGGTNVVWHYRKDGCRGYWSIGDCNADLHFVLHRVDQADINNGMTAEIGSWISIMSLAGFPTAPSWAPFSPYYSTLDIAQNPNGTHQGYLIIPVQASATSVSVTTNYLGYTRQGKDPSVLTFDAAVSGTALMPTEWRTDAYTETVNIPSVYSGTTMVSRQYEACDPTTLDGMWCASELWDFAPGLGLVRVHAYHNAGDTSLSDPRLEMIRQPS